MTNSKLFVDVEMDDIKNPFLQSSSSVDPQDGDEVILNPGTLSDSRFDGYVMLSVLNAVSLTCDSPYYNKCVLNGNHDNSGYGDMMIMQVFWQSSLQTTTFTRLWFKNGNQNEATMAGPGGGALYITEVTLTLADCYFTNNRAQQGGAIYISSGKLTLIGCLFGQFWSNRNVSPNGNDIYRNPSCSPAVNFATGCPKGYVGPATKKNENVEMYGSAIGVKGNYDCPDVCPAGRFSSNDNQGGCTECPTGRYNIADTTDPLAHDSEEDCLTCPDGEAPPTSSSLCTVCGKGRYTDSGICTGCPAGKYLSDEGTNKNYHDSEADCQNCGKGRYASGEGNHECSECGKGRYTSMTSATVSTDCLDCQAGKYSSEMTASVCVACEAGKFTDSAQRSECLNCTAGKFAYYAESIPRPGVGPVWGGDKTGATRCDSCVAGKITQNPGQTECTKCPKGTFQGDSGQTTCGSCDAGKYSFEGMTECYHCEAGKKSGVGSATCDECATGYVSERSSPECDYCGPGKRANSETNKCDLCPSNYYSLGGVDGCTFCPAGSEAGSSSCSPCPPGKFKNIDLSSSVTDGTNERCQECPKGKYAAFGDDSCSDCSGNGEYSDNVAQATCKTAPSGHKPNGDRTDFVKCPAGRFSLGGTDTCTVCGVGKRSIEGAAGCSPCISCAIGRYLVAECTTEIETECADCLAGTASMGGDARACTECAGAGEYSDIDRASACKTAPAGFKPNSDRTSLVPCPAGKFSVGGTTLCSSCDSNQYSQTTDDGATITGASSCQYCASGSVPNSDLTGCDTCPAGRSSTIGDTACSNCGAGRYSQEGAGVCTYCIPGTYSTEGSSSCQNCAAGYFSPNGAAQCTNCVAGKKEVNNFCENCPAGSFSAAGSAECDSSCPAGTFGETGKTECTGCPAGKFALQGASFCESCTAGTFSIPSSGSCTDCEAGKISLGGTGSCDGCEAGYYAPQKSSSCLVCTAGRYSEALAASCSTCAAGKFSSTAANTCTSCSSGKFSVLVSEDQGAASCSDCLAGKVSGDNAAECTGSCEPGTYAAAGSALCLPCSAGSFSGSGASSCKNCKAGKFSAERAPSCTNCTAGKYSGKTASSCDDCIASEGYVSLEGQGQCSFCSVGKRADAATNTCKDCLEGEYSEGGSDICGTCTGGQYSDTKGASSCKSAPAGFKPTADHTGIEACQAGHFSIGGASSCSLCPAGKFSTYNATKGAVGCTSCRLGKTSSEGSSSCSPCPRPSFSDDGITCKQCHGPGQYSNVDGAFACQTAKAGHKPTADRKGEEECPRGTFSTGGTDECSACGVGETSGKGAAGCSTCATCAAGRYVSTACSSTADTKCEDCLTGTASMGGDATECTPCTKDGEYSDTKKASVCKLARAGTKPSIDRTTIELCPKNHYSIGSNNTCTPCSDGSHSKPGSSACEKCSTGKYFDEISNECRQCPKNTFTLSGAKDLDGCTPCQNAGEYAKPGSGYCEKCPQYERFDEETEGCICVDSFERIGENSTCTCKTGETLMGISCSPCEMGKWKDKVGVTSCSRCEDTLAGAITATLGSIHETACICPKTTYDNGEGKCVEIVEGVRNDIQGLTLETLALLPGYWRVSNTSDDVRECLVAEACLGGNSTEICREGHNGPYCNTCIENYNENPFGLCKECTGSTKDLLFTIVTAVSVVLFFVAFRFLVKKSLGDRSKGKDVWKRMKNGTKVMFASGQITASLPRVIPSISLPKSYEKVVNAAQVLKLDLFTFVPIECWAGGNFNYYHCAIAMTLPVIASCVILFFIGLLSKGKKKQMHTAAIVIMYLTLPTITTTVFGLFPCDKLDDGREFLRADYHIRCDEEGRGVWEVFGYAMVVIFPVCVPTLEFFLLWRVKERIMKPVNERANDEYIQGLIFLWDPYKPEFWHWEVVETTRRLAMTGLLSIIEPGTFTQITTGLIMAAVYTIVLSKLEPYAEKRDTHVAILSSAMIELTFIASFLMKSQNLVESSYEAVGLGVLLVVCSILLVVLFVCWGWNSFHDTGKSDRAMALKGLRSLSTRRYGNGSMMSLTSVFGSMRKKKNKKKEKKKELLDIEMIEASLERENRNSEFAFENPMAKNRKSGEKKKRASSLEIEGDEGYGEKHILDDIIDKLCEERAAQGGARDVKEDEGAAVTAVWEVYHDDSGVPYYYNTETEQTSWEEPAGM